MKNYDFKTHILVWKGIEFQGFAEGTAIEVERAEDGFKMTAGADGQVVRTRQRNRTGSITVTLQRASPTNDLLSAIADADEEGITVDAGVGVGTLKDLNSATVAFGKEMWIRKKPKIEAATEHPNIQWVFDVAELKIFAGGATR